MKTRKKKSSRIAWEVIAGTLLATIIGIGVWQFYRLEVSNIESRDGESHLVYVWPETTVSALMDSIRCNYNIASPLSLRLHAHLMHYPAEGQQYARTGCYRLPARLGDKQLIRIFRNGWQEPVHISFKNIRTRAQLAARLSSQLMIDSASIAVRLEDKDYMSQYGLDVPNAVTLFIPDTYEMYWDLSADALFQRMHREYLAFWNEERMNKAKSLGFTPQQIATIASIVEEETNRDEVYLRALAP